MTEGVIIIAKNYNTCYTTASSSKYKAIQVPLGLNKKNSTQYISMIFFRIIASLFYGLDG